MLKVKKFINELMTSNCYVVYDEKTKQCLVIDPASEKSLHEIQFIEGLRLNLDYIILTHEHTDHTWGVNALKDYYPDSKYICSKLCEKYAPKASRAYFLFYYDDPNYHYFIKPADIIIDDDNDKIEWYGHYIKFFITPGHSYGSMCIDVDGMLFTGDTIMPFKPYFNGRDSNEDDWARSINLIKTKCDLNTMIYPGHGNVLSLKEWLTNYYESK